MELKSIEAYIVVKFGPLITKVYPLCCVVSHEGWTQMLTKTRTDGAEIAQSFVQDLSHVKLLGSTTPTFEFDTDENERVQLKHVTCDLQWANAWKPAMAESIANISATPPSLRTTSWTTPTMRKATEDTINLKNHLVVQFTKNISAVDLATVKKEVEQLVKEKTDRVKTDLPSPGAVTEQDKTPADAKKSKDQSKEQPSLTSYKQRKTLAGTEEKAKNEQKGLVSKKSEDQCLAAEVAIPKGKKEGKKAVEDGTKKKSMEKEEEAQDKKTEPPAKTVVSKTVPEGCVAAIKTPSYTIDDEPLPSKSSVAPSPLSTEKAKKEQTPTKVSKSTRASKKGKVQFDDQPVKPVEEKASENNEREAALKAESETSMASIIKTETPSTVADKKRKQRNVKSEEEKSQPPIFEQEVPSKELTESSTKHLEQAISGEEGAKKGNAEEFDNAVRVDEARASSVPTGKRKPATKKYTTKTGKNKARGQAEDDGKKEETDIGTVASIASPHASVLPVDNKHLSLPAPQVKLQIPKQRRRAVVTMLKSILRKRPRDEEPQQSEDSTSTLRPSKSVRFTQEAPRVLLFVEEMGPAAASDDVSPRNDTTAHVDTTDILCDDDSYDLHSPFAAVKSLHDATRIDGTRKMYAARA
mmetsp:Transcript_31116/g.52407  ORF Transcript_31116/g.52407 Transcript_31116/m.52407 type:complete len:639 (+) Transcript_31116:596-2512(+)